MKCTFNDIFDIGSKRVYTDEGFMIVPAKIARSGVQDYYAGELGIKDRDPKSIVKVYRPPEEVFRTESMRSFANKPVTDNHPANMVNSKNFKNLAVGYSDSNIEVKNEYLDTTLYLTDQEAINKVENGKVEISNGYTADIELNPGVTKKGESYDAIQKNIKGNHIALVDRARAGSECRLADNDLNINGGDTMATIRIDDVDYEVTEQASQAVKELQKKLLDVEHMMKNKDENGEMESKMELNRETDEEMKKKKDMEMKKKKDMEMKKKKDMENMENKKTNDEMQALLDAANEKLNNVEQMISDRMAFVDSIKKVDPSIDWQNKSQSNLLVEVLSKKFPKTDFTDKSDEYLMGRFDNLLESQDSITPLDRAFISQVSNFKDNTEKAVSLSDEARNNMIKRNRNLWKKGA